MKNTFTIPIIPNNDEARLNALYRYEILDTPPEGAFNRVAELAIKIFKVPIALISLVDKERVFFKANIGMPGVKSVPRGESLCSLAILESEPTVFENAEKEPCLLANPLVAGSFGLKFYAGAPLVTSDGYHIGTVCLVGKKQRKFTAEERGMLSDLTAIVMDEIEIRISTIKALREKSELMHIAAHDLKNPLANIQVLAELLKNQQDEEARGKMADLIRQSSNQMIFLIDRLVKLSEIENSKFMLDVQAVDPAELVKKVVEANQLLAFKKDQQIKLSVESSSEVNLDKDWINEIFDNLINNAIKYSPAGEDIEVVLKVDEDELLFEVKDNGQGFNQKDKAMAFQKFSKLSSKPTGGETSTGLGLSIVKKLVELHKGTIKIESEGKHKGSRIQVRIPVLASEKFADSEKKEVSRKV